MASVRSGSAEISTESILAVMTAPTAVRVDSSASGHKWPYVSSVVRALACRMRPCTVFMSAPEAMSSDAANR